jgi:transcriptional regulator with XRE-family HTH domain
VRQARAAVGMTQAELAKRLGSSAPYVSALENGHENPTIGQLSAIADALDVVLQFGYEVPERQVEPAVAQ